MVDILKIIKVLISRLITLILAKIMSELMLGDIDFKEVLMFF